jgi:hypothetical protein
VTSHEVVIRFGRSFDIRIRGEFRDTTEITIPFADQGSAEAALREVTLSVRAVHDNGGEDYRPVVAGEVVDGPAVPELPENDPETDALMVRLFYGEADAEEAISVHDALRKSARDAHATGQITRDGLEDRLRRIAFMERQSRGE